MHSSKQLLFVLPMLLFSIALFAQQPEKSAPIIYTSLEGENMYAANSSEKESKADTTAQDSVKAKGAHPFFKEYPVVPVKSFWSLYFAAGVNLYDGDFTSEKKHAFFLPTLSIGASCHFTNTWGLGLEYKFRNYRVFGAKGHASTLLKGRSHQANAYLTLDIFNCFMPHLTRKIFALDLILGGGVFWYKNDIYYPNEYKADLYRDFVYQQHTLEQQPMADDKFRCFGMFMGGMSFEWNVSRSLELGVRAIYNYSTSDQWDGRLRGNNNDAALDMEFLLRYKIDAIHKSNTRNFRSDEALATMVAMGDGTPKKNGVEEDQESQVILPDTVYVYQRDTLFVINRGANGVGKQTGTIPGGYDESDVIPNAHYYYVVYFDNDDPNLDAMAKLIVQEAAMRIQERRDEYALIIGSCDNTGAVEYNKWLAVTRAHNVANEMVEGYGVSKDKIHTVGRGIMIDNRPEGSFRPNRRVEIHLLKKAEFEQAIQVYKEFEGNKSVKKGSAVRHKEDSEKLMQRINVKITVPEDLNIADGDQITVRHNTTLQRLAQKYYGNNNCWIYLYLANGETVTIPDQVVENTTILLPHLTDKQRMVTTSEVTNLLRQYVEYK